MALDALEVEVAHVDAIELEQRQARGIAARMPAFGALEDFIEPQRVGEHAARLSLPVVEVARDDERALLRDRGANAIAEPFNLEAAAARPEAQVHVDAMQAMLPSGDLDL